MLRMKKNLKGVGAFEREALGIWDDASSTGVFTTGAWARAAFDEEKDEEPGEPIGLGIASDLDQVWLSLGAVLDGETPHVGSVLRVRAGKATATFVAEVKRIQDERGGIPVGIDKKGPASFLIPALEEAGVVLTFLGFDDYVQSCADLRDLVEIRGVTHGNYSDLNDAVDSATWRKVGDRRVFARKAGDISSLESVAVALRASALGEAKPKPFAFWG
jgi:hypothetical protein